MCEGKQCCQTCEHWGWWNWDEVGECCHPQITGPKPDAHPTDDCGCWIERKDKSQDGPTGAGKEL